MTTNVLSRLVAVLAVAVCALGPARALGAQEFKLVAHPSIGVDAIESATAQKVFLKQVAKLPSGTAVTPVDQAPSASVREAFSKKVVGRPVGAVQQYWQQKIFSGGDVPPTTKASDKDVVDFVKATPGAIGYVSASAGTDGVKVLSLK